MIIEDQNQKPESSARSEEKTKQDSGNTSPPAPPIRIPPSPPQSNGHDDDPYKEKTYRLSQRQFVVAIITLVVLAIYTAVAAYQACQMRKATVAASSAADTAAKEFEFSQRPWISLDNFTVESPLVFDKNGFHVTLGYELKNTGHSPAVRGFWQQDFFLQFLDKPSPVRKRDDACKVAVYRSTKVTDPRIAESWFPGNGLPQRLELNVSAEDIANALKIPEQVLPASPHMNEFDYIYPDFVICVAYRASFTETQYHTGYILELARTNPKSPYIPPMKNGEIPASELKLFIHPFFGINAD